MSQYDSGMSRDDQRTRILAATRELANGGPLRSVSMDAVAAAAGMSRATVYRYFPNKSELLRAAADGEADAADIRSAILESALQVFATHGVHGATLRQIAEQAGLSLSGLHWYFRNKEELVAALATHVPVIPTLTAEASVADSAELEDQLARIAAVTQQFLADHADVLRFAIAEIDRYPDVARFASTHTVGRALPVLASIFEEHARQGQLRPGPARVRAQAFMSMLVMLAMLRPVIGPLLGADDAACAREYVQIMLHGVLSDVDAPPPADLASEGNP
jgi:AcrR family transcriptional regulator